MANNLISPHPIHLNVDPPYRPNTLHTLTLQFRLGTPLDVGLRSQKGLRPFNPLQNIDSPVKILCIISTRIKPTFITCIIKITFIYLYVVILCCLFYKCIRAILNFQAVFFSSGLISDVQHFDT